ncbi:MAG: hypothetical protein KF823_09310 [Xanthomonadales bacterium]|nr:hypothetical protein [Xanthomonadales bacterium]
MKIQQLYLGKDKVGDLLRERLQLNDDVISQLLKADDWTMMILAWALVEACLNQAISKQLGSESLAPFIDRLSIGGRTGKSELALRLGLLEKTDKKFLDVFSEVRNRFAHGVKRFKNTFDDYFESESDMAKYNDALPVKGLPSLDKKTIHTFTDSKRTPILLNVVTLCLKLSK